MFFHLFKIGDSSIRNMVVQNRDKILNTAFTVTGQRGNAKLVLNGCAYIRNKQLNNKTYWICDQFRSKSCKSRLITIGSLDNIVVTHPTHSH